MTDVSINNLMKEYKQAKTTINQVMSIIERTLKDKHKDLDKRWELYLEFEKELEVDSCYFDIPFLENVKTGKKVEVTYYDDLGCERYQTISFSEIIERLNDDFSDEYTKESINELKELMLQSGLGGCVNDW